MKKHYFSQFSAVSECAVDTGKWTIVCVHRQRKFYNLLCGHKLIIQINANANGSRKFASSGEIKKANLHFISSKIKMATAIRETRHERYL